MEKLTGQKLAAKIAEELGEECSRLSLERGSENYKLFDALIRNVGLAQKNDGSGFVEWSEANIEARSNKEEIHDLDYYCREYVLQSKIKEESKKFDQLLKSTGKKGFSRESWRKIGSDRTLSEDKAEVFICCSAHVHSHSLKHHLAEFFSYCIHREKIKLTCLEEHQDTINTLISGELGPQKLPSVIQPHLTVPDARKDNPNYYANAIMDVVGRDEEKRRLKEFLNCDMNVAWLQLAGVAGQGKSRLAYDLVVYAAKELGWSAGFLEESGIRRFKEKWYTWQPEKPHLIVFDYVIGREDDIKPILQDLFERQDELLHNIRILLIERQRWDQGMSVDSEVYGRPEISRYLQKSMQGEKAGWYINLCKNNDYDGDDLLLKKSRFEDGVVELNELGEDDLVKIVKKVMDKEFSVEVKLSDTKIGEDLQRIDKSGRPLYAYFLAQELAHGENTSGWSNHTLLNKTLARERTEWWSVAFDSKPPVYEDDIIATRLAVLSTMLGGLDCNDISNRGLIPKVTPDDRRKALALTGCVVSKNNKNIDGPPVFIPPMKPDLLGEWYVIASFSKKGLPLKELINIAWSYKPESMGGFMQRLCQDFKEHPVIEKMLEVVDLGQVDMQSLSKVANIMFDYRCSYSPGECPEPIIHALHIRAKEGDPVSMYSLGYYYSNEVPEEIDVEEFCKKPLELDSRVAENNIPQEMNKVVKAYTLGIAGGKNIEKAVEYCKEAANARSVLALCELGLFYEDEKSVEKDLHKAVDYYWRAIKAKSQKLAENAGFSYDEKPFFGGIYLPFEISELAHRIYVCGIRYLRGQGVPIDKETGFDYLNKAAIGGDVSALFEVGRCYATGNGVEKDIEKSIDYFQNAAKYGHAGAMHHLAICYKEGVVVKRDDKKSFELLLKSAKAGYAKSMNSLGVCYQTGSGVAENLPEAVFWYQKGADAGNRMAMCNLSACYREGNGVDEDVMIAIKWYRRAAKSGFMPAMKNLGLFYLSEGFELFNPDKGFYWLERASQVDATDPETLSIVLLYLGVCYEEGIGVESDLAKAFKYYQHSHKLGEVRAIMALGSCYEYGVGVKADHLKAVGYYREFLETDSDVSDIEKEVVKEGLVRLQKELDSL